MSKSLTQNTRRRRWTAHCRRMAAATYALADGRQDLQLAAKRGLKGRAPPA